MGTTPKGFPYPDATDAPNGPAQLQLLALVCDSMPGISPKTYAEINAFAGAELWEGRTVYQTDTGTNRPVQGVYTYDGIGWRPPWNTAWGLVAEAFTSADGPSATAVADIPGLSVTFTAVTNRRYVFKVQVRVSKSSTAGEVVISVTTPGNASQWQSRKSMTGGSPGGVALFNFDFPVPAPDLPALTAGSITRKVRVQSITDSCFVDQDGAGHNYIQVYDDGPVPGTSPA